MRRIFLPLLLMVFSASAGGGATPCEMPLLGAIKKVEVDSSFVPVADFATLPSTKFEVMTSRRGGIVFLIRDRSALEAAVYGKMAFVILEDRNTAGRFIFLGRIISYRGGGSHGDIRDAVDAIAAKSTAFREINRGYLQPDPETPDSFEVYDLSGGMMFEPSGQFDRYKRLSSGAREVAETFRRELGVDLQFRQSDGE